MLYYKTFLFLAEVSSSDFPLWVKIIGQFGFPIALAVFLLWFIDKRLERFRNSLDYNTKMISTLVIAFGTFPPIVKTQTDDIIRRMDENNK